MVKDSKLPNDFYKFAARHGFSVFSASILVETFAHSFNQKFGIIFSTNLQFVNKNVLNLYWSKKEFNNFEENIGKKCARYQFANKLASKLITYSDRMNKHIKRGGINKTNLKLLIDDYRDFFCYHFSVKYASVHLQKLKPTLKIKKLLKILERAYKYNELVSPNVENFLLKNKISNFLHDEAIQAKRPAVKEKSRGVLITDNKRYVISMRDYDALDKKFQPKNNINESGPIKGIAVNTGFYKGVVRKVTSKKDLKKIQPGEVVVAQLILPGDNIYLKHAGAIITDYGSALSHVSIFSREYNIPCIVRTEIATKTFKTGEKIEVDAIKGAIKKI